CSTFPPASTCWRSCRSATRRAPWARAESSARRFARWRTSSATGVRSSSQRALHARHGVDLRGARGQRALDPALATVLAGEDLATVGRAEHAPGLALVERQGEHGGLRIEAHLHPAPARTAVLAAEERADVALEVRARRDPDSLGIARHLADVAAVGLSLRVQRLDPRARPVAALIGADEETRPRDGENRPGTPASDQDAVHVDGIVVQVLAVAHALPALAAVEASDDAADLDGAVDLVGIRGADGHLQDTLRRVRPGRHRDLRKAHCHRKLVPALALVLAPKDLAVLVAGVQHPGVTGIEEQGPHGQPVVGDIDLLPVIAVVRAAVGAVLRPDVKGAGLLGMRGYRANGRRLGETARGELPAVVADGHAIETRF